MKYRILGALVSLAAWSVSYAPAPQAIGLQIGTAAQAGVRWTPDPDQGSASSTLSGGRRGTSASACALDSLAPDPAITLLVPEGATGLTTKAQPTLSWYLESENVAEMTFMLSHPEQATPIHTQHISASEGLVEVSLPDSAALEVGTRYRWMVFLTCNNGENEVHARSFVERVAEDSVATDISSLSETQQAEAYAESGIWYDALNSLVSAYRAESQMSTLLDIRGLLEQADTEVPLDLSLATAS